MEIDRALENLGDMFRDRGEYTGEMDEHGIAVPRPRYFTDRITINTDRTLVIFALTKDLLSKLISEWKDLTSVDHFLHRYHTRHFVVVIGDGMASTTLKLLVERDQMLQAEGGMCQIWSLPELQFNPARHMYVPRHEKMSDEEVAGLMAEYNLKSRTQLPLILRTDKMARWLGLRHGDVVRITRHNSTSGKYFYYRCCM